jgi:hypothetical protein
MFLLGALISLVCVQGLSAQLPAKMQTLQDQMKANVAQIPASAEKDRWLANTDLWQFMINYQGNPPIWQLGLLKSHFHEMQANVAGINEPEEKERWLSNMYLWEVTIRHLEGDPNPRFFGQLRGYFARMQTNVARIVEPSEKERWQVNVDVWKIMIEDFDRPPLQVAAVQKPH